ncbi:hypothetical protein V1523DRAFT_127249 [Lipomyces doorenjongii]
MAKYGRRSCGMAVKQPQPSIFQQLSHIRDQLNVAGQTVDEPMFVEVFLRSLTSFYSDALPSLPSNPNMPVGDVFKGLTHFRLQREALTEGSTDAAYNVSVSQESHNHQKSSSNKWKKFQGRKNQRLAKRGLQCTHCGQRYCQGPGNKVSFLFSYLLVVSITRPGVPDYICVPTLVPPFFLSLSILYLIY